MMEAPELPEAGLCGSCIHGQRVRSAKGATFLRCNLSFRDPRFPRYPPLPVVRCDGYEPQPATETPNVGDAPGD